MAQPKYDGVVEAVHYEKDGKIQWVRAYQRIGPAFSDRVIFNRQTLIDRLKRGKKFYTGKRIPLMAGTFELGRPIKLVENAGKQILTTGDGQNNQDQLEGVPIL